jgi:hypothetical protein
VRLEGLRQIYRPRRHDITEDLNLFLNIAMVKPLTPSCYNDVFCISSIIITKSLIQVHCIVIMI